MVQDVNDEHNFVIVGFGDAAQPHVVGFAQTDVQARKTAEEEAHKAHNFAVAVYQRVGSVKVTPQAEWKGIRG